MKCSSGFQEHALLGIVCNLLFLIEATPQSTNGAGTTLRPMASSKGKKLSIICTIHFFSRILLGEKGNQIGRWAINSVNCENTTGSESSEPHPSPRGLAFHSSQAGLLAHRHPPPAPSHAKTSHSGILPDSSGLQQRGAAPEYLSRQSSEVPASRFTAIHGSGSWHLKL